MGRFLERFKEGIRAIENSNPTNLSPIEGLDNPVDQKLQAPQNDLGGLGGFGFDEVGVRPAQKPESFHHFILENQYRDLEKSIRGYKDVYNKQTKQWTMIRKESHCFTDEEAEDILRTAQSHLATDIKLSFINKDAFPIYMRTLYDQISFLFESIAEYKYGRYGNYEKQYEMKVQNLKIFIELMMRIQANYSRAISGIENSRTHDSVKAQESLQQTEQDLFKNKGYT